jgi:hypothetical protein
MGMLNAVADQMSSLVYNRAKHVIEENDRTLAAVAALKTGDFKTVGMLMVQSHISLKTLFAVSCEELDFLVDLALRVPGVYGSRMTGGGFGGCTISLVERGQVATARKYISDQYLEKTGKHCDCYVVEPAAGAGTLQLLPSPTSQQRLRDNTDSSILMAVSKEAAAISSSSSSSSSPLDWLVPTIVAATTLAIGLHMVFNSNR